MTQSTLRRGQIVHHVPANGKPGLGTGVILEEWGTWFACRQCYEEMDPKAAVCPNCNQRVALLRNWSTRRNELRPMQVSGRGVFEVKFADGQHPINRDWLRNGKAK